MRATVNGSVVITAGSTFQSSALAAADRGTRRLSLTIQNNQTASDSCWLFIGATAASATRGNIDPTRARSVLHAILPLHSVGQYRGHLHFHVE